MNTSGTLFIISAPSGAGKSSLVNAVLERYKPTGLNRVITYTTRSPRATDVPGTDYHFISEQLFRQRVADGFFLEWSDAYGALYGSPAAILDEVCSGSSYIMIVDHVGAASIKARFPEAVFVWITPPDQSILEKRLQGRNSENPDEQGVRLMVGKEEMQKELANPVFYHYIINDSFEIALDELSNLIQQYLMPGGQ